MVLLLLSVFLVGASSAADRPFDFSQNKDTSKAHVLVTEGNRMIDDIYSQFEAKDWVLRIRKFQIIAMELNFDSIGSAVVAHVDTFVIRDSRGNKVRFGNTDFKLFATQQAAWYEGDLVTVSIRYWHALTDSSFELGISSSAVWDTLNVLIIGEMK